MNYKYIVLDFGNVIAKPTTGHWDMTPVFQELVDMKDLDLKKFQELRNKYGYILSEKINTLEEEYDMFFRFYEPILKGLGYSKEIADEIAYDRTYNSSKYTLYENINNELSLLKNKYKLILLTDNWPCVYDYLREYNLDNYFEKIYVSSEYGVEKKDKTLFDYPISDFNMNMNEALFIDDNEINLDAALEKGFDVILMDRENVVKKSKYKIIYDLKDI